MDLTVLGSAKISLAAQFLINLVTLGTLAFVETPDDLRLIVALEASVQLVEFLWYATAVYRKREIVTSSRYIDWIISTPTMLLTSILFYRLRAGEDVVATFPDHAGLLVAVVLFNTAMLLCGLAIEYKLASIYSAGLTGYAMLVVTFVIVATFVPQGDTLSETLHYATFLVWSLYGVAIALPYAPKNIAYNLLDVVSKNFFGIFLFVYALA